MHPIDEKPFHNQFRFLEYVKKKSQFLLHDYVNMSRNLCWDILKNSFCLNVSFNKQLFMNLIGL